MSDVDAVKTTSATLRVLGWLVLLIGGIYGAAALYFGFTAVEPWAYGGVLVEKEWQSVALGFLGAAAIAVYTGVVWAVVQAIRAVLWYVTRNSPNI